MEAIIPRASRLLSRTSPRDSSTRNMARSVRKSHLVLVPFLYPNQRREYQETNRPPSIADVGHRRTGVATSQKLEERKKHSCSFLATSICSSVPLNNNSLQRQFQTSARSASTATAFSYGIAAAYSAKGRRFDPEKCVLEFDPNVEIQAPKANAGGTEAAKKSRLPSGEDAIFVSKVGDTGDISFGVVSALLVTEIRTRKAWLIRMFLKADGVGGWNDSGIDPADFSHTLCGYMASTSYEFERGIEALQPRALMQAGYDKVCSDKSIAGGGSTACVGVARRNGIMDVAK
jgi:hypothetical protein